MKRLFVSIMIAAVAFGYVSVAVSDKDQFMSEEEFLFLHEQEEGVFAETDQYDSFTPKQRAFLLELHEFLQALEEIRQLEQELLRYRGGLDPETCGSVDRTACLIYL